MTKREFFTSIITLANGEIPMDADEKTITLADLAEFATAEIEKADNANAKRREKNATKAKSNDENIEKVFALLTDKPVTGATLAEMATEAGITRVDDKPITPQYIARLMKSLVDDEKVCKTEIKVDKSKKVGYQLAK